MDVELFADEHEECTKNWPVSSELVVLVATAVKSEANWLSEWICFAIRLDLNSLKRSLGSKQGEKPRRPRSALLAT